MQAVEVRIEACARLKLEHLVRLIERPDAREGRVQMLDDGFAAQVKHFRERPARPRRPHFTIEPG